MPQWTCGDQRTSWSWLPPSIMRIPGTELRLSGVTASVLTHPPPPVCITWVTAARLGGTTLALGIFSQLLSPTT